MVDALRTDWTQADISAADRQMLAYCEKLTLRPWEMVEQDVVDLRQMGFTDGAILDINQVAGYYAYVNRLADGLGVEIEDFYKNGEAYRRYRALVESQEA